MTMRLVIVDWVDSAAGSGWREIASFGEDETVRCRSVGWIVRDTKMALQLVSHIGLDDAESCEQASGDMCIPKAAITRVRTLQERKR